jgi:hypothetical protein
VVGDLELAAQVVNVELQHFDACRQFGGLRFFPREAQVSRKQEQVIAELVCRIASGSEVDAQLVGTFKIFVQQTHEICSFHNYLFKSSLNFCKKVVFFSPISIF